MIFDQATDGKNVIVAMLLTGLVILLVIGLGELTKWVAHRRQDRQQSARSNV